MDVLNAFLLISGELPLINEGFVCWSRQLTRHPPIVSHAPIPLSIAVCKLITCPGQLEECCSSIVHSGDTSQSGWQQDQHDTGWCEGESVSSMLHSWCVGVTKRMPRVIISLKFIKIKETKKASQMCFFSVQIYFSFRPETLRSAAARFSFLFNLSSLCSFSLLSKNTVNLKCLYPLFPAHCKATTSFCKT